MGFDTIEINLDIISLHPNHRYVFCSIIFVFLIYKLNSGYNTGKLFHLVRKPSVIKIYNIIKVNKYYANMV